MVGIELITDARLVYLSYVLQKKKKYSSQFLGDLRSFKGWDNGLFLIHREYQDLTSPGFRGRHDKLTEGKENP